MASVASQQTISGFSRKHGVMVLKFPNCTLDSYLAALTAFIPPKQISHVSCRENNVIVYFSSEDWAEAAIIKGIVIDNKQLDIRPVSSTKIIISDVPPEISDICLREILMKYGTVVGPITSLRAETENTEFSHILSFRRRAFFDFSDEESIDRIPKVINITIDDVHYSFEIEIDVECTHCKEIGHIKKSCPKLLFPPTIVIKEEVESDSEEISVITEIKHEKIDNDSEGLSTRNKSPSLPSNVFDNSSISSTYNSFESLMPTESLDPQCDLNATLYSKSRASKFIKPKKDKISMVKKKPEFTKHTSPKKQALSLVKRRKKNFGSHETKEFNENHGSESQGHVPDFGEINRVETEELVADPSIYPSSSTIQENVHLSGLNTEETQEINVAYLYEPPISLSDDHQNSPSHDTFLSEQPQHQSSPLHSSEDLQRSFFTSDHITQRSSSCDNVYHTDTTPVERSASVGTYPVSEHGSICEKSTYESPLPTEHSPDCSKASNDDDTNYLDSLLRSAKKRKQDCRTRSQKECGLCLYNDLAKLTPFYKLPCDN